MPKEVNALSNTIAKIWHRKALIGKTVNPNMHKFINFNRLCTGMVDACKQSRRRISAK